MTRHQAPETDTTRAREREEYLAGPWTVDHHGKHNEAGES